MRLQLIAVGRLKDGPERELCARYATRIRDSAKPLGFGGPEMHEITEGRGRRPEERKIEEAAAIRARLNGGLVIALDERGRSLGSDDFAARLARERDGGVSSASFVIGGADGLDDAIRTSAGLTLCFGTMTIPHQLVRVLVLEQIYRALTILAGHPYHRV